MRKRRRAAELQDKRDRIRMGLIPPDPPKGKCLCDRLGVNHINVLIPVRLANIMKVLTSDAVQDPTRVEARVRREVAIRKHGHEKMNAERKLTEDQRREKVENKKLEEEKKGIYGAVFKCAFSVRSYLYQLTFSLGSRRFLTPHINSKFARTQSR